MLRKIAYTLLGLVVVVLLFAIAGEFLYEPMDKDKMGALIGNALVDYSVDCKEDFIGISIHGDIFDFYRYSLNNFTVDSSLHQFPNYEMLLNLSSVQNVSSSTWKRTPIDSSDTKFYKQVADFQNLMDADCSRKFVTKDYVNDTGNFFTYYSAYPVGTHFYALVPDEKKLFVIRKK